MFLAGMLVGFAAGVAVVAAGFGLSALWIRRAEARELDEVLNVPGFDDPHPGRRGEQS